MKKRKWFMAAGVGALLLAGALTGCGMPTQTPSAEGGNDTKALQIEKRSCQTGETVFLLQDTAAAEQFYEAYFDAEDPFEPVDVSVKTEGLTPQWEYIVYQEMTVQAGETESKGYQEILRYTLYEDSDVITMEVAPGVTEELGFNWLGDMLTWNYEGDADKVAYLKTCTMEELT